jgi:hypothetical protein
MFGYGLDGRDSIIGGLKYFFFTTQGQEQLWSPPSLLSNGQRWIFHGVKSAGGGSVASLLKKFFFLFESPFICKLYRYIQQMV